MSDGIKRKSVRAERASTGPETSTRMIEIMRALCLADEESGHKGASHSDECPRGKGEGEHDHDPSLIQMDWAWFHVPREASG